MTWLSLIAAVLSAVAAVVDYLKSKQAIDAATAELVAGHLKGALDDIQKANAARDNVRAAFDADAQLRDPDPNRRD